MQYTNGNQLASQHLLLQNQMSERSEDLSQAHASLVESCLAEVLLCQQSIAAKAYIAALLKTANGFKYEGLGAADTNRLKSLAGNRLKVKLPWCSCMMSMVALRQVG